MITLKMLKEKLLIDNHSLYFQFEKNNKTTYLEKCKTIPQAWHLFLPLILQREVGLFIDSHPSAFTAIFNGKIDNGNHGVKNKRDKILKCFTEKNFRYFEFLEKHCEKLITNNISMECYLNASTVINSININKLENFLVENRGGLEWEFQEIDFREQLYNIFQVEFENYISSDVRITKEIKHEIISNAKENFAKALAWLIIISLFPIETNDNDSLKKIQEAYLKKTINVDKSSYNQHCVSIDNFLIYANEILEKFTNSLLACKTKWGPFSKDQEYQFANMCEGLLAMDASGKIDNNYSEIQNVLLELELNKNEFGISSKSLQEKTVVPTSMYLLLISSLYKKDLIDESCWIYAKKIAYNLWNVRNDNGWGIYVKKHKNYACNIGCTYWALTALKNYNDVISNEEFIAYLSGFYRFAGCYNYGSSFNTVCFNKPYLYSSAMMFTLFLDNGFFNNVLLSSKYNYRKALNFIIDNMFKNEYLSELEEIEGTDDSDKNNIRYVSWSHITLRYCMDAIASAINCGILNGEALEDVLNKLLVILEKYNFKYSQLLYYWKETNRLFDKDERGFIIFPTMHIMMGLASICNALNKLK